MLADLYTWTQGRLHVTRGHGSVSAGQRSESEPCGPPLGDGRPLTEEASVHGPSLRHLHGQTVGLAVRSVDLPTYSPVRAAWLDSPVAEQFEDSEARTDWVEFRVEDGGGAPVADVRYVLTLPDGSKRQGVTPANGVIYWKNIATGECELSFPDLDQSEWSLAQ